ncbi:Putative permease MJ0326 [Chlamydiales bacterium SCGC AG-110-P3]|nr:Putative permease MJ0326 [Chlamydiales bacterium SCGC AG-110-P3]
MTFLERIFHLSQRGTSVRTEILAGITTFSTMVYIVFLNPVILADAGMDFSAVMVSTILAAALATLLMGIYGDYPFAQAPGMGLNAYFTYGVVITMGHTWQAALGASFVAGAVFLILNLMGLRRRIMEAIAPSLRIAVTAGLGLFLALIGLKNVGLIAPDAVTVVSLGRIDSPELLMAGIGLIATTVLLAREVRGAFIFGIALVWLISLVGGYTTWQGAFALPPSVAPTFLQLDIKAALQPAMLGTVTSFVFIAIFDTAGTLTALAEQGGFLDNKGRLPRAQRALVTDAVATMLGAAVGTSVMTTYLESAAGIQAGGRTGLTAIIVALLFLCTLAGSIPIYATTPVLLIIGAMMLRPVTRLNWDDPTEMIPAFLILVTIPLTFSIATGIGVGFIVYPAIKLLTGRHRDIHALTWILGIGFFLKFIFLPE